MTPKVPERRNRTAFVLVATLMVLAMAGVILASVARRSAALALQANAARQQLQLRWAMTSLQHTFLPKAEETIATDEGQTDRSLSWTRREVLLNDNMRIDLLFGDEQAKASISTVYQRRGAAGLTAALRKLSRGRSNPLHVVLRPRQVAPTKAKEVKSPFVCFGQLFDPCPPGALTADAAGLSPAVAEITCWGDGKLNFRRTSRAALGEVSAGVLRAYQQAKLVQLRRERPGISLEEAFGQLGLTDKQRTEAGRVLTDQSMCYSLWIIVDTGSRRWYRLAVADAASGKAGAVNVKAFAW